MLCGVSHELSGQLVGGAVGCEGEDLTTCRRMHTADMPATARLTRLLRKDLVDYIGAGAFASHFFINRTSRPSWHRRLSRSHSDPFYSQLAHVCYRSTFILLDPGTPPCHALLNDLTNLLASTSRTREGVSCHERVRQCCCTPNAFAALCADIQPMSTRVMRPDRGTNKVSANK